MQNIFERIFCLVVLCILCFPVTGCLLPEVKQVFALDENRMLQEFPEASLNSVFNGNGEFFSEFEEWFNDHFQFRDFLIRTKGEISYRVFNLTGSNGVYVGDDGYMYYKSVIEHEQITNELMSEEQVGEIVDKYERIKEYTNSKGKEFLFMIPPQKNTVFPERSPEFNVERRMPNQYENILNKLINSSASEDFIDVIPILRGAERNHPTYYKTDFHWNGYGATMAFASVVNILAEREGLGVLYNDDMYEIYYNEFQGGQLNNMPLLENWTERAVFIRKKTALTASIDENETEGKKLIHYINSDTSAPLGCILLIGDSYTEYMLNSNSGILDMFKEAYFVHLDIAEHAVSEYIDKVDYVVVERIETGISYMAQTIDRLL